MKKAVPPLFLVLIPLITLSQRDTIRTYNHENSFGLGVEIGGKTDYAGDIITINGLTRNESTNSAGLSFFYEHQFNFGRRSAFSIGGGINATMFNIHLRYTNPSITYIEVDQTTTYRYSLTASERDLKKDVHSFYALDIPLLYSFRFIDKDHWKSMFYTGFKLRNVSYIFGEQRNRSEYRGTLEREGDDTLFYMNKLTARGSMTNSRVIPHLVLGTKISKRMSNGGLLNFYADYNLAFGNQVEMRYRDFSNVEKVKVYRETIVDGTVVDSDSYEEKYTFINDNTLFMALKMSHIRFGISFTLPGKSK